MTARSKKVTCSVTANEVETATPEEVDAYDLDDDGKISLAEMGRAQIGIVDA